MGYLMRRNILAYKAPPNNEGYDLICIHPDPKKVTKQIRIQVKSRYQSDSNRDVPITRRAFEAFDYIILVFLNIGYFYRRKPVREGVEEPELYVLPRDVVEKHHYVSNAGWEKLLTANLEMGEFEGDDGIERIAEDLGIDYPHGLLEAKSSARDAG